MASMEALYGALRDQIQSFEGHIRSCQKAFDLHTLYNVLLLLLPEEGDEGDIQCLEQLEKLVESKEWDGQDIVSVTAGHDKCDIPSYIAWFISYVRYLGSLKEVFDNKVVFPLCENLYVNDDSLDALPFRCRKGHGPHATASIARTAKQLFALRRKWALLLKGGTLDERAFSTQSLLDLQGFANVHPFVKVMRLVPDLFHKSLATAELARHWMERHASRHRSCPVRSDRGSSRRYDGTGPAVGSLEHHWYNVPLSQPALPESPRDCIEVWPQSKASSSDNSHPGGSCMRSTSQEVNQLHEVHEELTSLLWREERSWTLEAEIQEVNQKISNLQLQQEAKERELEALEHQWEEDNWSEPVMQRQAALCELDALGRQLRLEEYRKIILQGDWLLELEMQERCQELVRLLEGREEVLQDLQPANGIDSYSSCSSGCLNRLSSGP